MSTPPQLARSFAYVAPCMATYLAASRDWRADILCLDLEDATPPKRKNEARSVVAAFLTEGRPRAAQVVLRVNSLDGQWGADDLAFAKTLGVDGVVLPKAEGAGPIAEARAIIGDLPVWCMIETAMAILRVEEAAAAGIQGMVIGGSDLAESLGVTQSADRLGLLPALGQVVLAGRAYGVPVIDAHHHDFTDMPGLEAAAQLSVRLGFNGKSVFSAETVAIANRIFRPSEEAVRKAEAALSGASGYGEHIENAKRTLDLARLAAEMDGDPT